MEKEFINYTEALALKELGFDEPCFGWYAHNGVYTGYSIKNSTINELNMIKNSCSAPLYQQAFRWFREKKINSIVQEYAFKNYMFSIDDGINRDVEVIGYNTYEEAELECLKKLIEIVKEKK